MWSYLFTFSFFPFYANIFVTTSQSCFSLIQFVMHFAYIFFSHLFLHFLPIVWVTVYYMYSSIGFKAHASSHFLPELENISREFSTRYCACMEWWIMLFWIKQSLTSLSIFQLFHYLPTYTLSVNNSGSRHSIFGKNALTIPLLRFSVIPFLYLLLSFSVTRCHHRRCHSAAAATDEPKHNVFLLLLWFTWKSLQRT